MKQYIACDFLPATNTFPACMAVRLPGFACRVMVRCEPPRRSVADSMCEWAEYAVKQAMERHGINADVVPESTGALSDGSRIVEIQYRGC